MEKWYVIRTSTNKEKECKDKIENEIKFTKIGDMVKQIVVPLEKTMQLRQGKKIVTTRNHYPGYVLIETNPLALPELASVFKHINFVIGFLGKSTPIPLKQNEIETILGRMDELQGQEPVIVNNFNIGEMVKVVDGPFNEFFGKVIDFNSDKNKVKINITVFGRETSIELNTLQVSKEI